MSTFATILAVVLGVVFLGAGGTKLAGVKPHPEEFERFELPGMPAQTARLAVGAFEVVAALMLLVGAIIGSRGTALFGAVLVVAAMVGAIGTHGRIGDPASKRAPAIVLLVLAFLEIAAA